MPDLEDDSDIRLPSPSEEAKEASSRESLPGLEAFLISEKPRCDMLALV